MVKFSFDHFSLIFFLIAFLENGDLKIFGTSLKTNLFLIIKSFE